MCLFFVILYLIFQTLSAFLSFFFSIFWNKHTIGKSDKLIIYG